MLIVEIALDPDCVKRNDPKKNTKSNSDSNLIQRRNEKQQKKNSKIPETYYIVTDNRYVKQRGLIVWSKTLKAEKRETRIGLWAILFYVVIILSVVLYQTDWNKMYRKFNKLKFKLPRY